MESKQIFDSIFAYLPNFAFNLKQLITPDIVNIYSFWKQIRILQNLVGDDVFC